MKSSGFWSMNKRSNAWHISWRRQTIGSGRATLKTRLMVIFFFFCTTTWTWSQMLNSGVVLFFTYFYADHILKMVRTSHLLDVYRSVLLYFDIIAIYFYQFRTGSNIALALLFVSSRIQHLNFNHYEYWIRRSQYSWVLGWTIWLLWSLACCRLHCDPILNGIHFFSLRKMYQYSETLALLFLSLIP